MSYYTMTNNYIMMMIHIQRKQVELHIQSEKDLQQKRKGASSISSLY